MLLTPAQVALLVNRYRTYTVVCAATTTQTVTISRQVGKQAAATTTQTVTISTTVADRNPVDFTIRSIDTFTIREPKL